MLSAREDGLSEERKRDLKNPILDGSDPILVRFNGVASERNSDVNGAAGTSCSVFAPDSNSADGSLYHLLIDAGAGALRSIEGGIIHVNARESNIHAEAMPDCVLISHDHMDHIADLPDVVNILKGRSIARQRIPIYCAKKCQENILKVFPTLSGSDSPFEFNIISPGDKVNVGPFSVIALKGDHDSDEEKAESLVFVISHGGTKIVSGWDFRSLVDADESLLWNPALLILGTESYNPHPSMTGMISVSDAFNLARRWNAKEVFLIHYSGTPDLEDGKNQWFMGPTKPMSLDELQEKVDKALRITGVEGKFRITIAKQGMIWSLREYHERIREYFADMEQQPIQSGEDGRIGPHLEIEALDKYLLKFDSLDDGRQVRVTIEDKVRSFEPEFELPRRNANGTVLKAHSIKGMLTKGPELSLLVMEDDGSRASNMPDQGLLELSISKGKKMLFNDMIPVTKHDAMRLAKYVTENFKLANEPLAA